MPGLHLILKTNSIQDDKISQVLEKLEHDKFYHSTINYSDSCFTIGSNYYKHYPIQVFDTDKYQIFLEGEIYSCNNVEIELQELAQIVFHQKDKQDNCIKNWLLKQDGEFLVIIKNKENNNWAIINDILGRLPLYLYNKDNCLILSREVRFITSLIENIQIDKLGLAQYLYFGYGINNRTFLSDIESLPPASFLFLSENGKLLKKETTHTFNFENKDFSKSIEDSIDQLENDLHIACKNRASSNRKNILSLSGGLDSRVVAVGLQKANVPFESFTFEPNSHVETLDLKYAKETADVLKLRWEKILLSPVYGKDIKFILDIKGGMNIVSSAIYLPFMREIENRYEKNITYFSGDGGDKLLPNLLPFKHLKTTEQLAKYIMQREKLMPFSQVSQVTGVSEENFFEELIVCLDKYRESDCNQKYVHFMIYERAMRWLFEGEDCNRCSFWATTPFYSLNFFKTAMSIPDKYKKNHVLYKEFLNKLSPKAASVADAKRNKSILSNAYKAEQQIIGIINKYPRLADFIKKMRTKQVTYDNNSLHQKMLSTSVQNNSYLNQPTSKLNSLNIDAVDNMLTLFLALENHLGSPQTIDQFLNDKL